MRTAPRSCRGGTAGVTRAVWRRGLSSRRTSTVDACRFWANPLGGGAPVYFMKNLETPRYLLRRFEESDFEDVHQYGSDPKVTRYQFWGPNDETATREFIRRSIETFAPPGGDDVEFAIVDRETSRVIGGCGIHARRKPFREFEIGWTLNRAFWRRGVATEAASALMDFAFSFRRAHRLFALIDVENVASIALAERLGFLREGRQSRDTLVRGEWRDSLVYARLSELEGYARIR